MAYYGIPSAGLALTASTANDTVAMANLGGTTLTANSIYGADGNDIISLGAVGRTAIATASATRLDSATGLLTVVLNGSASYTATVAIVSGALSQQVAITGVVTSQQAARTVNGSLLQGNAGNDSIILGDRLTQASASTFGGGAGNDWIGAATNVNNAFATSTVSGATFNAVNIEGGNGNDTIYLDGSAVYSALNVNANQGNDLVYFNNAVVGGSSIIGLGANNDELSGDFGAFNSSTIAGGEGNDTISFTATIANLAVLAGDRANNLNQDGDGNDSIYIGGAIISSTVYGGGGNDSITWSATQGSGNFVSLNDGGDIFSAQGGSLIQNGLVSLGKNADLFHASGSTILSSTINLGNGLDTVNLGGLLTGGAYGNTTINGGAGNDLLLQSAGAQTGSFAPIFLYNANSESTISAFDTIAVNVAAANSGSYQFRYELGGATQASFSASQLTATNGVVTFTATYATDVTSRASAVAANTSNGNAAVFIDGSGINYLFVKGASENLIVQVGTQAVSGGLNDASLSIGAGKNVTLNLG
jgi:hypothetical protein